MFPPHRSGDLFRHHDKDPETCAKWAEKTKAICGKISKADCQDICVKDENPTACDIAKTMK